MVCVQGLLEEVGDSGGLNLEDDESAGDGGALIAIDARPPDGPPGTTI
jgi:hypothetical protein